MRQGRAEAGGTSRDRQRGTSCPQGEGDVRRRLNQSGRSIIRAGNEAEPRSFATSWGGGEFCEQLHFELIAALFIQECHDRKATI